MIGRCDVRMLATVFAAVLAFGSLLVADVAPCRADARTHAATPAAAPAPDVTAAPQPGTDDEERAYARREAESPDAQEFAGGFIGFLILVALVVIIILLVQKG